ncbi:uncharacterized protein LOC131210977 [Anopheles bellator]|uniref:uncharacterized protein LOC131210977 n=1 Tax=Anopheles bellator TaxID=139047 RepID=UPI002647AE6C|nr:uncharacterized protein LOC131210977 [Anopheles bellator]
MSRALSLSATVLLVVVMVPLVIGAPTVHLPDLWYDRNSPPDGENPSGTVPGSATSTGRPHSVEPTWITVTMNPAEARYDPPGGSILKPMTAMPYVAYVPVPPVQHYRHATPGWPGYFPGPPVLPPPYPYHHLCGQHANQAYRLL